MLVFGVFSAITYYFPEQSHTTGHVPAQGI